MDDHAPKPSAAAKPVTDRDARLAKALRDNLRRRKGAAKLPAPPVDDPSTARDD